METVWHENGRSASLQGDELRVAALGMLEARRAMRGFLPAALVHDVALEMLLMLFAARPAAIQVDALLDDATMPPPSARRWLMALVGEDLVRLDDSLATLTDHGLASMSAMLDRIVRSQRELNGWAGH